ncbi:putative alpha-L-rhamnosidase C [Aspergillus thermomutatus]|uniref:Alpha-L-rhamnosidase C-terminal domain-containing protein n=1 Tax=Aspergillus thermomutatus TaxID=41047 RepID=A0A397FX19_ASPTH|nr:uncharacterized protein CDV56_100611 [Aspergillus thermomutatus]RHZ43147.1 hypothetical protein CDV56_100611 [Aspergillus thermomutatus]
MRALALLPFFASAALGSWTLAFYTDEGCRRFSSFIHGPLHGWAAVLYNGEDCTGDSTTQTFTGSSCAHANWYLRVPQNYKSFKTNRALGNPRRRTILKVHAIARRQGTLLAVEDLAGGTHRGLDGNTLPGLLAEDRARLTDGLLLRHALLPVEPHPRRAGRLLRGRALLAVERQPLVARGHGPHAVRAVEGVARLAVQADEAEAAPVCLLVVGRALWVLGADALLAVEDGALETGGDAGDAVAGAVGDGAGGAGRGAGRDAAGAVEGGVLRAAGEVARGAVLAVKGGGVVRARGVAGSWTSTQSQCYLLASKGYTRYSGSSGFLILEKTTDEPEEPDRGRDCQDLVDAEKDKLREEGAEALRECQKQKDAAVAESKTQSQKDREQCEKDKSGLQQLLKACQDKEQSKKPVDTAAAQDPKCQDNSWQNMCNGVCGQDTFTLAGVEFQKRCFVRTGMGREVQVYHRLSLLECLEKDCAPNSNCLGVGWRPHEVGHCHVHMSTGNGLRTWPHPGEHLIYAKDRVTPLSIAKYRSCWLPLLDNMGITHYIALGLLHAGLGLAGTGPLYVPLTYSDHGASQAVCNGTTFTLSSNGTTPAIIVLDYGRDVEGYGTFQVARRSGNTSVFEMSYSETRALLDTYMADGPLPLAAAMDTYRINRYNITEEKTYTNRLIQGALRYQKLNLSSAGELELTMVGFTPTVDDTPLSELPGSFNCSDPVLNRIWAMGARTVQLNEFPAASLPEFWTITDEGALVESLAPQPFAADYAATMTAYEVDFAVKPIANGFGFTVLSDTLGNGVYTFVDVANAAISAHAGSSELGTPLTSAALPPSITLNRWHRVRAAVNVTQVSVEIDGVALLDFSQTSAFYGSFGLGASLGHTAVFTNVSLTAFGAQMYASSLSDKSALKDFLLGTNPLPVSVDGSRRDRIAYAGDLDITAGAAFASTNGTEYINGSIALLGSMQMLPGFFVPNAKVQQEPRTEAIPGNLTGLIGYSFSLASAMAQYYEQTGDDAFLKHWAPRVARLFDWAHSQTLPSGLFNISDVALGGDWNYYDPPLSGAISKFNLIYVYALKQWLPYLADGGLDNTTYAHRLHSLQESIRANLWSDQLHAFYLADSHPAFFSQEANALAILTDTVPPTGTPSARTLLSSMARLYVPAGALAFSPGSAASGWAQKISPYASGYHLQAAFHAHDAATATHLLHTLWGPMSDPAHANYTGCTWETLDPTGRPGLGAATSLCHAWGAAPTAELSRHVLGIRAAAPGFARWTVRPLTLGLRWARGRHPVPRGAIHVDWSFDAEGLLAMRVSAPAGTGGIAVSSTHLTLPTDFRG